MFILLYLNAYKIDEIIDVIKVFVETLCLYILH